MPAVDGAPGEVVEPADQFAVDLGTPRPGIRQPLEDDHRTTFGDHNAGAIGVERPRGRLGRVIALGQRAHVGEGREAHLEQGRLGAAGDDDVDLPPLDHARQHSPGGIHVSHHMDLPGFLPDLVGAGSGGPAGTVI